MRRAMFDMLVYCRASCDEQVYCKKASKSKAMQAYRLKPLVWLRPELVFAVYDPLPDVLSDVL